MRKSKHIIGLAFISYFVTSILCAYINLGTGSKVVQVIAGWLASVRAFITGKKNKR